MSFPPGNALGKSQLCCGLQSLHSTAGVGSAGAGNLLNVLKKTAGNVFPARAQVCVRCCCCPRAGVWLSKCPRRKPGCVAVQERSAVLVFCLVISALVQNRRDCWYSVMDAWSSFSHSISFYTLSFPLSLLCCCVASSSVGLSWFFPLWNLSSAWQCFVRRVSFIPCSVCQESREAAEEQDGHPTPSKEGRRFVFGGAGSRKPLMWMSLCPSHHPSNHTQNPSREVSESVYWSIWVINSGVSLETFITPLTYSQW